MNLRGDALPNTHYYGQYTLPWSIHITMANIVMQYSSHVYSQTHIFVVRNVNFTSN